MDKSGKPVDNLWISAPCGADLGSLRSPTQTKKIIYLLRTLTPIGAYVIYLLHALTLIGAERVDPNANDNHSHLDH